MFGCVQVEDALLDLIGRRCFSAITGSEGEFAFALHLGAQQRRQLRLANPRLSFLQRTFEGSHMVVVECTWRIDGPDAVIASCFDRAKPAGPRDDAVEALVERTVVGVQLMRPGLDLEVRFEGGHTLHCFATEVSLENKATRNNWTYSSPFGTVTVGPRSRLTFDHARPVPAPTDDD